MELTTPGPRSLPHNTNGTLLHHRNPPRTTSSAGVLGGDRFPGFDRSSLANAAVGTRLLRFGARHQGAPMAIESVAGYARRDMNESQEGAASGFVLGVLIIGSLYWDPERDACGETSRCGQ